MGEKKYFYLDPDERKWTMGDIQLSWGAIINAPKRKNALEGIFLMKDGQIIEWSELLSRCSSCLHPLAYNEEHDSEFCEPCDEWREDSCTDPDCEYCLARPDKPSHCKK